MSNDDLTPPHWGAKELAMNDLISREAAIAAGHDARFPGMLQQRASEAIRALPAVTPAVKVNPLVWRDDGTNGHETDHAFGFYEVYPSPEGDMLSRDGVDSGVYSSIEAAKAAAQADYEARILSALDVTPASTPHEYQPSLNPNDQGECVVCGGGPHTRIGAKPAPTLAAALALPEIKALVEGGE